MIIGIDCSRAFVTERTGTENYSYHLVTQLLSLPEAKPHTFVLFTRPNAVIPEEILQSGAQIRPIAFPYLWTQVGLAWQTWQEPGLDILWVPSHTLPVLRKSGLATVVTIHGLEYQWLPEYKNLLQRWYLPLSTYYAARAANRLIAVSNFTAQQLIKELQTDQKKITVVQEGMVGQGSKNQKTKGVTRSLLEGYGLQDQKYLLFVGTVQPRKNLVALIKAFAQLPQALSPYRLVIAGGIGWMAEEVLAAPLKCGVQERVVFTGRVSEATLTSLYGGAALYVQPSLTEGFGLPVLEAMDRRVPVISSDGGALPEVVSGAGMVVPLTSRFEHDLARAMTHVLTDPSYHKVLSSAGKKRAARLTWRKAARATLAVLTK